MKISKKLQKQIRKEHKEVREIMEEVKIYRFQLKAIYEALRVTANIHESRNKAKEGRTCHDRMVTQAEQYAENALNGKKDTEVRYV